ncbi:MAG TPA: nucleotidyltransferase family protein [Chthoniobacterales bacterium]|jgi:molybdenum cofactor cytidylyltransferase|nr:nucleotidyltransferase family protein [Chthoniobacterales bacterium]
MRNVAAVILAAGGSWRFGRPKQLLTFRGETLVRRAVHAAAEAGCDPVIVVAGDLGDAIRGELQSTSAIVVENPAWQRGLGTSIRRGLREVVDSTNAVVLVTCDQPLVDEAVIEELIVVHEKTGKPMVASGYANTLGVPALFDRSCFAALLALPDDSGAKALLTTRPNDVAAVAFEQGAVDIDTPEDFERLMANAD